MPLTQKDNPLFQAIADLVPGGVFLTDLTGRGVYISRQAGRMVRISDQAVLNRWEATIIHPEDLNRLRTEGDKGDEDSWQRYRILTSEGESVWVNGRIRLLKDAMGNPVGFISLATDLAESEAPLRRSDEFEKYRVITEYSTDIISCHQDSLFTFCSSSVERVMGYQAQELIGRSFLDFCHPDDGARLSRSYRRMIATGKSSTVRYRCRDAGGEYHWLESSGGVLPQAGLELGEMIVMTRKIDSQVAAEDRMRLLASHDVLTGALNRRTLELELRRLLKTKPFPNITVLYIDLDNFKQINDCYGHAEGDAYLRIFYRRLRRFMKEGDLIARLGGDEFACLVRDVDFPKGVEELHRRIRSHFERPAKIRNQLLPIYFSLGISKLREGDQWDSCLQRADRALYVAKRRGKNQYRLARFTQGKA